MLNKFINYSLKFIFSKRSMFDLNVVFYTTSRIVNNINLPVRIKIGAYSYNFHK